MCRPTTAAATAAWYCARSRFSKSREAEVRVPLPEGLHALGLGIHVCLANWRGHGRERSWNQAGAPNLIHFLTIAGLAHQQIDNGRSAEVVRKHVRDHQAHDHCL